MLKMNFSLNSAKFKYSRIVVELLKTFLEVPPLQQYALMLFVCIGRVEQISWMQRVVYCLGGSGEVNRFGSTSLVPLWY
jgi:hypothetical protein